MNSSLAGRTFVITGATSGIGLATAKALAERGASIIGIGRVPDRCGKAEEMLRALHRDGSHHVVLVADLSLQPQVRSAAQGVCALLTAWGRGHLDGLINNAATVPFWQTFTPEGFDLQWAVNHLAAFLLTIELLPSLNAAPMGRVVSVSSASHYHTRLNWEDIQLRKRYNPLRAYSQTKLANILFALEFNRRFAQGSSMRAFAADPGLVNTELGLKSNSFLARWVWNVRRRGGTTPEASAKGIVYLASEPAIQDVSEVYWKDSRPKKPSPYALNAQAARQLWELSAQMCGMVN